MASPSSRRPSSASNWRNRQPLDEYLREHNRRFAVAPRQAQDMLRAWTGSAQALADICSLHHQRQLSAQGACRFEGSIVQLLPGQAHAPKAKALVDIAQHDDGSVHLSYRGQALEFRRYAARAHDRPEAEDHKTLTARVDKVCERARSKPKNPQAAKLARLKAEMAFQDSQRNAGIYRPDTPPIVPPRGGFTISVRAASDPLSPSTAVRFRKPCWRVSCLAM